MSATTWLINDTEEIKLESLRCVAGDVRKGLDWYRERDIVEGPQNCKTKRTSRDAMRGVRI